MKPFYYTRILPLLLFFITCLWLSQAEAATKTYRVTRVNDGDTITVREKGMSGIFSGEEKVRLIGIDAPELKQEPWGRRAARRLKELVSTSDWVVTLETDADPRDKHGRLLAYVWDSKGRMLNEMMVAEGYAMIFTFPPNVKYTEKLRTAQETARNQNRGVWGKKGLRQTPSQWRREHPR
ncbi:MAG: thermonuclease family protein [Nitrospirales bacterium]|nr:thermonuclease family protein [Nitrospirales bacterium]